METTNIAAPSALEQLAEDIRTVHEMGLGYNKWHALAQAALAKEKACWLHEQTFRSRTGASDKWCRKHFEECAEQGLARRRNKRREWHIHARRTRPGGVDMDGLKREIVESHEAQRRSA
ncbi:hypothetical protein ACFL3B_02540 [Gemmatimonadota bacterium]